MSCSALNNTDRAAEWPLGPALTERLLAISASHCDGEGGCHGPDHTARVHSTALHIGRLMGARLDVLSGAALLHDIGRRHEMEQQGKVCHAAKGADMARDILLDEGLGPELVEEMVHCIASHRYRGGAVPQTLEARILFDADKLDSIGAIGIGRAFLFAGQLGAKLHNTNSCIEGSKPYSVEDTAYREFKVKMCKIRDRMLTLEGKRLAYERHAFMEIFFERLDKEIRGGCQR